jgi:hypothetical protein
VFPSHDKGEQHNEMGWQKKLVHLVYPENRERETARGPGIRQPSKVCPGNPLLLGKAYLLMFLPPPKIMPAARDQPLNS